VSDAPPVIAQPVEPEPTEAAEAPAAERRSTAVELLWDLVFVFAITEVTTLLSGELTWAGFGRSMLVLALVWWAWSAFVWAANAADPESWTLRVCLLLATVFIFIAGLALPSAFRSSGTLFAVSYAAVRFLHLGLYADASRRGNASWSAIIGFAFTVAIGMALLVIGSLFGGTPRIVLWAVAVAIDYAGPAWLTRERLRGLQHVAVAHFAERYGLFVIICLGESIVAVGVGARSGHDRIDAALVVAVSLALLITIGLWWTYFDQAAAWAEERLRQHTDPVLAAADAYSYLHLLIVAGIITFAVGARVLASGAVGAPLAAPARLALCGGIALYLVGLVSFGLRIVGRLGYRKLVVAAAMLVLFALGGSGPRWVIAAVATLLLAALCAAETAATAE
jgi:low temperature requirement protein LtrA